jgi:hypothetical protein
MPLSEINFRFQSGLIEGRESRIGPSVKKRLSTE